MVVPVFYKHVAPLGLNASRFLVFPFSHAPSLPPSLRCFITPPADVAPLGLGCMVVPVFYKHVAPLELKGSRPLVFWFSRLPPPPLRPLCLCGAFLRITFYAHAAPLGLWLCGGVMRIEKKLKPRPNPHRIIRSIIALNVSVSRFFGRKPQKPAIRVNFFTKKGLTDIWMCCIIGRLLL